MRGKKAPVRKIQPDSRYNNPLIAKFINYIMANGKKSVAERIVYTAFDPARKYRTYCEACYLKEVY